MTSRRTRPVGWIAVAAVVLACTLAAPAEAQPIEEPKTYAGDFWSRPRLTGDWGGFRRPNDTFGLGWARTEFSSHFVPFLRERLDFGLDHEDAIEMYCNAAITPWLNATADLQIIDPALKKTLGSDGRLRDVDTAVVAGLRLNVRF